MFEEKGVPSAIEKAEVIIVVLEVESRRKTS